MDAEKQLSLKKLRDVFHNHVFVLVGTVAKEMSFSDSPVCSCSPFIQRGDCEHVAFVQSLTLACQTPSVSLECKRDPPRSSSQNARLATASRGNFHKDDFSR